MSVMLGKNAFIAFEVLDADGDPEWRIISGQKGMSEENSNEDIDVTDKFTESDFKESLTIFLEQSISIEGQIKNSDADLKVFDELREKWLNKEPVKARIIVDNRGYGYEGLYTVGLSSEFPHDSQSTYSLDLKPSKNVKYLKQNLATGCIKPDGETIT